MNYDPEIKQIGIKYDLPFFFSAETFEEQKAEYRKQSTVSGKAASESLGEMLSRMQRIVDGEIKAGILTPTIKNERTGEILHFTVK